MIKNKIFRRFALLVSLIMLLTSTVNTTFGFIVTKTDSLVNTFVPFESVISNLLISKSVEHPFGDEYVIPGDIAFDFKVDFGSLYANTAITTTAGDMVADENGSILISVKPRKTFAVEGVDAGTKVTVTEIQKSGSGFAVKDGAATMEGIVAEDGSLQFHYVNVYAPASVSPANVFVSGSKILEGRDWREGDFFSFTLEQKQSDATWAQLSTETVTYSADDADFNQFDFSDSIQALTFDKVGTYNFRMTEVVGNLENVDYDKSVNTFAIGVTDVDMDGKLEINTVTAAQNAKVNETDGKYNVPVTFNNTFDPPAVPDPDPITVRIDIDKKVNNVGELTHGLAGFEFVLENTATSEKIATTSDDKGRSAFTLTFDKADISKTHTYKLSETNQGLAGMTYDADVHEITVSVSLNTNNELVATLTMDGQSVEALSAAFENTYDVKKPDSPATGDRINLTFWFIMMIVSGSVSIFLVITDIKYRTKENR